MIEKRDNGWKLEKSVLKLSHSKQGEKLRRVKG